MSATTTSIVDSAAVEGPVLGTLVEVVVDTADAVGNAVQQLAPAALIAGIDLN
jgi:hypothetical protein